jgi:thiol-disulfide isomerase/thioredoxin
MSDAATTAPSAAEPIPTASEASPGDELLAVALTDVRTGATFSLGELATIDGPVLLEPMAVWCTSCRAQQHEVKGAHEQGGAFTSVSLDVDLSESPEDLAAYADREGFDWRFAMADASLYRLLQDRFGVGVTNPPSTPLIVIEPDGTVRALELGRGVRDAEQLLAEIGPG